MNFFELQFIFNSKPQFRFRTELEFTVQFWRKHNPCKRQHGLTDKIVLLLWEKTVMGRLSNPKTVLGQQQIIDKSRPVHKWRHMWCQRHHGAHLWCAGHCSITTLLWERVGRYDDTNKNELLQHGKTDVDLSFPTPPILFLHLVDFFSSDLYRKSLCSRQNAILYW